MLHRRLMNITLLIIVPVPVMNIGGMVMFVLFSSVLVRFGVCSGG